MPDKMMRIAGRNTTGTAKAIKTNFDGMIETQGTVAPMDIVGEVLEPYPSGYQGITAVLGLGVKWRAETNASEQIRTRMAYRNGMTYVGRNDGRVYVFNDIGGITAIYDVMLGETITSVAVWENGNLLFGTYNGKFGSFAISSKKVIWVHEDVDASVWKVFISGTSSYVVHENGTVKRVSNGKTDIIVNLLEGTSALIRAFDTSLSEQRFYFGTSDGRVIETTNSFSIQRTIDTGEKQSVRDISANVEDNPNIYTIQPRGGNGVVKKISGRTGKVVWESEVVTSPTTISLIETDGVPTIFVATQYSNINCYNDNGDFEWRVLLVGDNSKKDNVPRWVNQTIVTDKRDILVLTSYGTLMRITPDLQIKGFKLVGV